MLDLSLRRCIPIAKQKKQINYKNLILNTLKEKYFYLLSGLTVLIVVYFFVNNFFIKTSPSQIKNQTTPAPSKKTTIETKKYVVKEGDDLWSIAEAAYGSGYNFVDIASANNLVDVNIISVGQELVIPAVSPKEPTKGEVVAATTQPITITGAQYTVKSGDYLWKIALEAYGDGYAWTRIAQANNLTNADIIYEGNVLLIPK